MLQFKVKKMNQQKQKSRCNAVIGLGYGDEGKGLTVGKIAHNLNGSTVVVRYSGGPQAAHRVVTKDGLEKIFSIYDINLKNYVNRIYFVDFDLEGDQPVQIAENHVKTNLLKPENWQTTIDQAKNQLDAKNHPTIVFGAALNILFFSPTFGNQIFNYFKELIESGENSLFTISNNVFEVKMRELETRADNLLFTHSGRNLELHLQTARMKDVPFKETDLVVPLTEEELRNMRSEAERMRKHLIPLLKKI